MQSPGYGSLRFLKFAGIDDGSLAQLLFATMHVAKRVIPPDVLELYLWATDWGRVDRPSCRCRARFGGDLFHDFGYPLRRNIVLAAPATDLK